MRAERFRQIATSERVARHAGFWWGLAEGTFFFIVPDVYISFAALFSLRAGAVAWGFSIIGSVVAIPVIYAIAVVLGLDYVSFLEALPAISDGMIGRVTVRLSEGGLPYTPLLLLGGVPLKVYGGLAFSLGASLGGVLLWTVFARLVRIAPTYVVLSGVRLLAARRIDARPGVWSGVLGLSWIAFYAFYFITMGRS